MKLRSRFILLLIVLVIAFTSIAAFTSFSLMKINRFTEIDKKVYQLYNLSLEMKKNESDYFKWDLKNPEYFQTGRSENLNLFNKNFSESSDLCSHLLKQRFIKRNKFKNDIEDIKRLLNNYHSQFLIIEKNKLDLGFENWGLQGQINTSARKIEEEIIKQNNPDLTIKLLKLRQHEKDYLFRRNFQHKEQFDRELYSTLKKINNETGSMYNSLKYYGASFNNMVEKDFYIGIYKDEGLVALLENNSTNLNKAINLLSHNITKKANHFIIQTTLILITFIILSTLITLLTGFLIIKRIMKLMGGEPEEVASITKFISKGDLRFNLKKSSEYKGLMKSIVIMTEKLKGIISGIYYNSFNIAIAGRNFANSSNKISIGVKNQSYLIEEITSEMTDIGHKTRANLDASTETNNIAIKTREYIQNIKNQSELSYQASTEIAEKIKKIDQITFQTKILALNTAIEAARIWNNKNGFKQIAEEIQRLAEASKDVADEIKHLTTKNQTLSEQVRNMVFETLESIEKTTGMINNIYIASNDQYKSINLVSESIITLHAFSQENFSAAEEMTEFTEELEKQIISLKEMVSYFKVDKGVENGTSYDLLKNQNINKKKKKKKILRLFNVIKTKGNLIKEVV